MTQTAMKRTNVPFSIFNNAFRNSAMRAKFFTHDFTRTASFHAVENATTFPKGARNALADALAAYNKNVGAGEKTMEHIEAIRDDDTYVIVTGQQPTFLTGPLFTIYKTYTAIRLARDLAREGIRAVPLFWNASNDSDIFEVNHIFTSERHGGIEKQHVDMGESPHVLSSLPADGTLTRAIENYLASRHENDFHAGLTALLTQPATRYAEHFSMLMAELFRDEGLIVIEPHLLPSDAPAFYEQALTRHDDIVARLDEQSARLKEEGLPVQIETLAAYHVFAIENGVRTRVTREGDCLHFGANACNVNDLSSFLATNSTALTFDAVLRIIRQQQTLPALAYVAGPGEYNYLAQVTPLYAVFGAVEPVIYPRASITLLEEKFAGIARDYGFTWEALFSSETYHTARQDVEDETVSRTFDTLSRALADFCNDLTAYYEPKDKPFTHTLEQFHDKIGKEVDKLKQKAKKSLERFQGRETSRLARLEGYVLPRGGYQERTLNIFEFVHRHGRGVLQTIADAIEIGTLDHQLIFLA